MNLSDIVAQPQVTQPLQKAIALNRLPQKMLFYSVVPGVGKSMTVQALLDELGIHQIDTTLLIGSRYSSHNAIIEAFDNLRYYPVNSTRRVIIFEEVHAAPIPIQNQLLVALDQLPNHALFIATTTEIVKLIEPLRSRLISFEFKPLSKQLIITGLKQYASLKGLKINSDSIYLLAAQSALGSLRTAINELEKRMLLAC